MSVRTSYIVWKHSMHSGTELLMLLALADFSDDSGNSYPGVNTLAEKCRMSPRNVNYILSALQASGELEVLMNEGPKGTNRYRITLDLHEVGQPSARTLPDETATKGKPKPKAHSGFDPAAMELPDWLPRGAWDSWCADRRERKKALTQRAAELQIKKLARYVEDGVAAADVIEFAIESGHQGFYYSAPKTPRYAASRPAHELNADEVFT